MLITVEDFVEAHGGWWNGECPAYPKEDWRTEVANGDTLQGYWDWAYNMHYSE